MEFSSVDYRILPLPSSPQGFLTIMRTRPRLPLFGVLDLTKQVAFSSVASLILLIPKLAPAQLRCAVALIYFTGFNKFWRFVLKK